MKSTANGEPQTAMASKRPPLWSFVKLQLGQLPFGPEDWHLGVVVRHSGSARFWVMSRSLGGLVDSLAFPRLNVSMRLLHPRIGSRAKLRFLPNGKFINCVVSELLAPPPEVIVKLNTLGETFDSRTFAALGIELQFLPIPELCADTMEKNDENPSKESVGGGCSPSNALKGRQLEDRDLETKDELQYNTKGPYSRNGGTENAKRMFREEEDELKREAEATKKRALRLTQEEGECSNSESGYDTPQIPGSISGSSESKSSLSADDSYPNPGNGTPNHEHASPRSFERVQSSESSTEQASGSSAFLSEESSEHNDPTWNRPKPKRRKIKNEEGEEDGVRGPSIVAEQVSGRILEMSVSPVQLQYMSGSRVQLEQWILKLCRAVSENFSVNFMIQRGRSTADPSTLSFYGLKSKSERASATFVAAFEKVHRMARSYTPSVFNGHSANALGRNGYTTRARNSYALGIVEGVLAEVRKKMETSNRPSPNIGARRARRRRAFDAEIKQESELRRSSRIRERSDDDVTQKNSGTENGIGELLLGNAQNACIELRKGRFEFKQKIVSQAHSHGARDSACIDLSALTS